MRVLGIDPGSHRTGWGVIDAQGTRLLHVESGALLARGEEMSTRLASIYDGLTEVIGRLRPQAVAVETVFFAKNSQSALTLGQARGVAIVCAARAGTTVVEYTAGQIKQAVTGRGRAEKAQVQEMIRLILGLTAVMSLDESDALAAAICHAQTQSTPLTALLANEARRTRRQRSRT